jgi:hypothetical protein
MDEKKVQLLPYWQALGVCRARGLPEVEKGKVYGIEKLDWINMCRERINVEERMLGGRKAHTIVCEAGLPGWIIAHFLISQYEPK